MFPPALVEHDGCCTVTSCREHGCSLNLGPAGRGWRCVSGTSYQRAHAFRKRLCDAIVFVHSHQSCVILTVELKSGRIDVDEVAEQLRNGAEVADRLGWPERDRPQFLPVVLTRGRQDPIVHRLLHSPANWIRFRSRRPVRIDIRPCGTALSELLGCEDRCLGLGGDRGPEASNSVRNRRRGRGRPPGG